MSLPLPANITCDLYRTGNAPPAAPDVGAVTAHFRPDWRAGQEAGERTDVATELVWTHILLVDASLDIRDGYTGAQSFTAQDDVYIPDQNGTRFRVVFVERIHRGLPTDHKRVYLDRQLPSWPSNDV